MLEAAKKVIEYAVGTLNIQTIEAFTQKNNQPSIQLLDQLAFKKLIQPDKTDADYLLFMLSNKI
jgi:[ribosomal protein S5]-alanine N-acetyltransferase